MEKQATKPIVMHYPVEMVVKYARQMKEHVKKENNGPAEVAMFEDIVTMLEIAQKNMVSVPAHPENDKTKKQ